MPKQIFVKKFEKTPIVVFFEKYFQHRSKKIKKRIKNESQSTLSTKKFGESTLKSFITRFEYSNIYAYSLKFQFTKFKKVLRMEAMESSMKGL